MMSMYEKCCMIREFYLRRTAEVLIYKWSDDFCMEWLKEIIPYLHSYDYNHHIDPNTLTKDEMILLGFGKYGDNNYLVPLWLYPFLADELELNCIDGTNITKKSEMDDDNRGGMLAYYITKE